MERLPDWEERLNTFVASRAGVVFEWGAGAPYDQAVQETDPKSDCAMLAAGFAEAVTGVDKAADLRGRYHDKEGADAVIAEVGGPGGLGAVVEALGLPRVHTAMAQRGDIVLTRDGNLGGVYGSAALCVGEDQDGPGLLRIGRDEWLRAWHLG